MPIGPFKDFAECEAHMTLSKESGGGGYDAETAKKVCGSMQAKLENAKKEGKSYPWDQCMTDALKEYGDEETAKKVCGSIKAKYGNCGCDDDKMKNSADATAQAAPPAAPAPAPVAPVAPAPVVPPAPPVLMANGLPFHKLFNAGNSDGARKGWDSRGRAAHTGAGSGGFDPSKSPGGFFGGMRVPWHAEAIEASKVAMQTGSKHHHRQAALKHMAAKAKAVGFMQEDGPHASKNFAGEMEGLQRLKDFHDAAKEFHDTKS